MMMTVLRNTQIVLGFAEAMETPTETEPPTAAALVAAPSDETGPIDSSETSSWMTIYWACC